MQIHNAIITGSFSYNGADLSNVTSSNAYSASLSSRTTDLESTSSVLVGASSSFSSVLSSVSSSQQQISASLLQVSASYISLSGSYNTFSGSASTRITENSSSIQQISASLLQVSASYTALSGSYNTFSGSASTRTTQIEQVYATTGSNSFRADQSITGSLVVSSTITAQTLVVQTVTSSILYSSGSNLFGNALSNTQTFTGSVNITGSLTVNTTGTEFQVNNTGVVMGNVLTDNHSITGSLRVTGSTTVFAGSIGINGSPGNSFPIESYINSSTTYTSTSRGNVLRVYNSNTTANIYAGIELGGAGASNDGLAGINGIVTAAGSGDLAFYTRNSNTFGEKMRITSAGRIGIGITNPAARLQNIGSFITNTPQYGEAKAFSFQSAFDNPTINLLTIASTSGYGMLIIRVTVYQNGVGPSFCNIHVGYAYFNSNGNASGIIAPTIQAAFGGSYVGTLAWSGTTLQYTSNRMTNYDGYTVVVEWGANVDNNAPPTYGGNLQ